MAWGSTKGLKQLEVLDRGVVSHVDNSFQGMLWRLQITATTSSVLGAIVYSLLRCFHAFCTLWPRVRAAWVR